MKVRILPKAKLGLLDLVLYLLEHSPEAAERLQIAAEAAFMLLAEYPEYGRAFDFDEGRPSPRRVIHPVGFSNHTILYRVLPDEVQVLDVFHAAQDPRRRFSEG